MISAISGYNPSTYGIYGSYYANRAAQTQGAQAADKAQYARSGVVTTAQKVHQPEAPVEPVTPVRAVSSEEDPAQSGLVRYNSDAAEMAVRMRIQYPEDANAAQQGAEVQLPGAKEEAAPALNLPGTKSAQDNSNVLPTDSAGTDAVGESKSAQEVMEEGECQTCKERKYQDGSDDPGVSFKTPTHIDPDQAASAVRGHENEHVVREQAQAKQEGREVVSQSVTYHTDICPECGKVYVSGGTTRTVTKAATDNQPEQQNQDEKDSLSPAIA